MELDTMMKRLMMVCAVVAGIAWLAAGYVSLSEYATGAPEVNMKPLPVEDPARVALRVSAGSNIVAMADMLGVTTRPVPMNAVKDNLLAISQTNVLQALFLSQMLQGEILSYTLNGGDIWKVGLSEP
jgi:hypothetical protein